MVTFEEIKKNKELKEKFKKAFLEILEECDEFILPGTSIDYILNVFERKGYWAGIAYNISFGPLGFEYEQRRFG